MRCWHCKSDMPDGLKYCGKCGVHMNRAVHLFNWLFSKKGLPVLILLIALIAGGIIWAVAANTDLPGIDVDLPVLDNPFDNDNPGKDSGSDREQTPDYGVYPYVASFIAGDVPGGGVFQNEDLYTYLEGGTVNYSLQYNEARQIHEHIVTGEHPHDWGRYKFVPELEDKVNEYLELLDGEPFVFELIRESEDKETGTLTRYYRYTGTQSVFSLQDDPNSDLGDYHLMVSVDVDENAIFFSVRAGLGLESIYREEYEAILDGEAYQRTVDDAIVYKTTPAG